MLAFAWDLETNARSSNTFVNPHVRVTKKGRRDLDDPRDIYELNANLASRRLREAIFAVLPPWYKDEAVALCNATLDSGGGEPLVERRDKAVERFADGVVTAAMLEHWLGDKINPPASP